MNLNIFKLFFKQSNQKLLKRFQIIVDSINDLEHYFKKLSDNELKKKLNFLNIV